MEKAILANYAEMEKEEFMGKKLNTCTLSGLIIGPILGSGIVLLPPIAYEIMGDQAIYAWLIIMALGAVFAYVFTQLSIMSPGNEGVSIAIGKGLGQGYREMASNFLIAAVAFGPVAVLNIASEYINEIALVLHFPDVAWTLFLIAVCALILLRGVKALGGLTLILSSLIGILILIGGISTLISVESIQIPTGIPRFKTLGQTLLLLFWAIIGWEVIGSYVEDVENPKLTLNRSMYVSLAAITIIYIVSAFSLQNLIGNSSGLESIKMSLILTPLFGGLSIPLMGLTASGLCICTYLMVVGGVTRLAASKAQRGGFSDLLSKTNVHGAPKNMIMIAGGIHSIMALSVHFHWVNAETLVILANTFFIGNAMLGLAAAFTLLKQPWIRASIIVLLAVFIMMLLFSSAFAVILAGGVTVLSFVQARKFEAQSQYITQ